MQNHSIPDRRTETLIPIENKSTAEAGQYKYEGSLTKGDVLHTILEAKQNLNWHG